MSELSNESCIPCRGGIPPLTEAEYLPLLESLNQSWEVINNHHLKKDYTFKDYKSTVAAVNLIAEISESENHHPNISFTWGKLTVTIWSHKIDGLTKSDFILAAKINDGFETKD